MDRSTLAVVSSGSVRFDVIMAVMEHDNDGVHFS
jgi:hypothetical protein